MQANPSNARCRDVSLAGSARRHDEKSRTSQRRILGLQLSSLRSVQRVHVETMKLVTKKEE